MRKLSFYFMFLLVFTIPWQNVVAFPGLGTISRLIGFVSIGIALLLILMEKRVGEIPLILILMVIFVSWNLLTYFWSINPSGTIGRFVTFAQLLAMVWLVWELCRNKKDGMIIMQAFVLGAYVAISDMLLTYFTSVGGSFRIAATGFNPNWLAISLAIGIPIAWYLVVKFNSKFLIIINLLYVPLAIFCVILTASRGGFITALIGFSIIPISLIYIGKYPKYTFALSIVFVLAIIPLFSTGTFSNIEQNIARLTETSEMIQEGRMTGRENIWKAGFKVFRENSLIGVGSGGFRFSVESIFGNPRAAHNAYLSVMVDTGMIGFLLFMAIFYIGIKPNVNLPFEDRIFFIILLMTIMVGLIPANMEANKITWLVCAFLITQTAYVIRKGKIVKIIK